MTTPYPEASDRQVNSHNKDPLVERPHPNVEEKRDNNGRHKKKSTDQARRLRPQQQFRNNNKPKQARRTGATKDDNKPPSVTSASTTDPRNDQRRLTAVAQKRGKGRNTESFDPASTLVRPAMRIRTGHNTKVYTKPLQHDDVIIVPDMFGAQDDFSIYHDLCREMTQLQQTGTKGAEWIAWHEGAHLISKQPGQSKTFQNIVNRLCEYFQIDPKSAGTRLNWYKDSRDWKPFHHDSAAFNPQRAKTQNITVGVSFGASRELAFLLASDDNKDESSSNDVRLYFPQPNNGVFSFGRDVNIRWKHGINALPDEEEVSTQKQDTTSNVAATGTSPPPGRISIILWGLAGNFVEEDGSPALLGSDGQGPHAAHNNKNFKHHKHHRRPRKHK